MSKIIILKSAEDNININKFKFKEHFVEIIQITKCLNKILIIDKNFKNVFYKIKYTYYNYLAINELKNLIKENSFIILSKSLKKYEETFKEIFEKFYSKYKIHLIINDKNIKIENLVYKYIENINEIYSKNVALILDNINNLNKEEYINIAKISKKIDIITKKIPNINRVNVFVNNTNKEYGMFNEIKNIKDLRDYSIVVNLDRKIDSLQLFTYNKQAIYIDCKNIFTRESYNYLNKYNVDKYIDKENLNILLYLNILKDKELYKNINILYKENQIYISELLYLLNN